jgi:hypothetical protein
MAGGNRHEYSRGEFLKQPASTYDMRLLSYQILIDGMRSRWETWSFCNASRALVKIENYWNSTRFCTDWVAGVALARGDVTNHEGEGTLPFVSP